MSIISLLIPLSWEWWSKSFSDWFEFWKSYELNVLFDDKNFDNIMMIMLARRKSLFLCFFYYISKL